MRRQQWVCPRALRAPDAFGLEDERKRPRKIAVHGVFLSAVELDKAREN